MIVAIRGGLGNQLSQATFALALKKKSGRDVAVDARDFPNKGREYLLDRVGLRFRKASEREIFAARWGGSFMRAKFSYWLWKYLRVGTEEPGIYQESARRSFESAALEQRSPRYFRGYWMSYHYYGFAELTPSDFPFLFEELTGEGKEVERQITDTESVGVHIRRGDYATVQSVRNSYLVCSPEYFQRAMSACVQRLKSPRFFLFSDDEEYVRSLDWEGLDVTVVSISSEIGDEQHLRLLSSCRHQIISNSTFSWWAAFLNSHREKLVFCPDRWEVSVATKDLVGQFIPPEWHLVSTATG